MEGPNGQGGSRISPEQEKDRLWELFARTGFPCALRALRELERQEERVVLKEASAA